MIQRAFSFGQPNDLLYCFEMANNHQGSVEHGKSIIANLSDIVKRLGVRAMVKLQFRDFETFLHPADRMGLPGTEPLTRHTTRFLQTALSRAQFEELVGYSRTLGLPAYSTPFDETSVDLCLDFGFDVIKVGSCSAYDWPLLRRIAETKLPVIVSLAGATLNEINDVVDFFRSSGNPLAIMHCIGVYPAAAEDLQMDVIRQLRERYPGVVVGYSGHEPPGELDLVALAVAKGATILERHVGFPTEEIKLNAYSLTPDEVDRWIAAAQRAVGACANGTPRRPVAGERESLLSLKRGIYAQRTIPAGHTIRAEDVFLAMPCLEGQFHAGKYWEIVDSYTPMRPIDANMPLGLDLPDHLPKPLVLASIAARVKEMLEEAKISLDDQVGVELSHQYGVDRFYEVGAVIIDIVNREYCKKLVLQFPGQTHPNHKHVQKEETFQVLSGTVDLLLDGEPKRLVAGQKQLVEREQMHAFSTETGMIFEEISTTHIRGDSIYEDQSVPSDPTTRKTKIVLPL